MQALFLQEKVTRLFQIILLLGEKLLAIPQNQGLTIRDLSDTNVLSLWKYIYIAAALPHGEHTGVAGAAKYCHTCVHCDLIVAGGHVFS